MVGWLVLCLVNICWVKSLFLFSCKKLYEGLEKYCHIVLLFILGVTLISYILLYLSSMLDIGKRPPSHLFFNSPLCSSGPHLCSCLSPCVTSLCHSVCSYFFGSVRPMTTRRHIYVHSDSLTTEWTGEWWQWRGTPHSPKLQHYWNLTIILFSVISGTLDGECLTPLQRSSWCILHLEPTGQDKVGLVGFYGISTIVGYLMPNPLYTYISNIYNLVWLGFMAYQPL